MPMTRCYARPKLTLILSISEMGKFLLSQFHSHFLPNDFAFLQFSTSFVVFMECGKLPKCKVIWQKVAVELTILLGIFFRKFEFFSWVYPENFMGFVSHTYFLTTLYIQEVTDELWAKNPMKFFHQKAKLKISKNSVKPVGLWYNQVWV